MENINVTKILFFVYFNFVNISHAELIGSGPVVSKPNPQNLIEPTNPSDPDPNNSRRALRNYGCNQSDLGTVCSNGKKFGTPTPQGNEMITHYNLNACHYYHNGEQSDCNSLVTKLIKTINCETSDCGQWRFQSLGCQSNSSGTICFTGEYRVRGAPHSPSRLVLELVRVHYEYFYHRGGSDSYSTPNLI